MLAHFSLTLVSPYGKAELRKRLAAATIDGLVLLTCLRFSMTLQSASFLVVGALYVLLRDAVQGRSLGKFLMGLVVIRVQTGRPCGPGDAIQRNLVFLVPGANVVAVFLETLTITRDPQGMRLGDRVAQTQVVEGLGARDLVSTFMQELLGIAAAIGRSARPGRGPADVKPLAPSTRHDAGDLVTACAL